MTPGRVPRGPRAPDRVRPVTSGLILVAGGAAAGMFGSLLGLGGGLLIVPLLTLAFGVPLREAVAVSLVASS